MAAHAGRHPRRPDRLLGPGHRVQRRFPQLRTRPARRPRDRHRYRTAVFASGVLGRREAWTRGPGSLPVAGRLRPAVAAAHLRPGPVSRGVLPPALSAAGAGHRDVPGADDTVLSDADHAAAGAHGVPAEHRSGGPQPAARRGVAQDGLPRERARRRSSASRTATSPPPWRPFAAITSGTPTISHPSFPTWAGRLRSSRRI